MERKTSAHTRLRFIALLLSARSANVTAANRELRVDRAGNFFGDGGGFLNTRSKVPKLGVIVLVLFLYGLTVARFVVGDVFVILALKRDLAGEEGRARAAEPGCIRVGKKLRKF